MSMRDEEQIRCPNCGKRQKTTVWTGINIRVNPELREELYQDRLNVTVCPKCNIGIQVVTGLYWNDMDKKVWIEMTPHKLSEKEKEDWRKSAEKAAENFRVAIAAKHKSAPRVDLSRFKYMSNPVFVVGYEELKQMVLEIEGSKNIGERRQGAKNETAELESDYADTEVRKEYYESGQLKLEANFKDGKQNGISKAYYESGQLEGEGNFKDGKAEGISKAYYESGQLKQEVNYEDDKREGLAKEYYESGELQFEGNFKDDKPVGIGKTYDENGNIQYIETYKKGQKTNIKTYDENGKLKSEQDFPTE